MIINRRVRVKRDPIFNRVTKQREFTEYEGLLIAIVASAGSEPLGIVERETGALETLSLNFISTINDSE